MTRTNLRQPRSRVIIALACAGLLAGCSFFSQTVTPQRRDRIHAALPIGLSADEAEAKLNGLGFSCIRRSGDYPDENGNDVAAHGFLQCTQRPGTISFNCENRDQVYVALAGNVVDHVSVVRGPDCSPVEHPTLVK
ncbi:MAG: hypothetical protein JWR16_559 [Nevskia sp.]|nr:hypothetical protein [Nevskia sp.]